jgi:hypothetical protein
MESDRRGFRDTASAALFPLLGALVWAVCSSAAAAIGLYVRNRLETDHAADIIMLFFAGGLFGWLLAMAALHFLPASTALPLRFAAACLAIAFFTLAVAAAFFAFEYRIFYAQWHAPASGFSSSSSHRSARFTSSAFSALAYIFPLPSFRSCLRAPSSADVRNEQQRHVA